MRPWFSLLLLRSATVRLALLRTVAEGSWLAGLSDGPWTYAILGATAIVTEEFGPIFGGIAAYDGELQIRKVFWAITIGGWGATTLLYGLGWIKWEAIRRRFPRTRATGTVALRVVRRHPLKASFFVRFAFGLRIVLPIAAGAAKVRPYVYLPVSFVGSALWTAVYVAIGYAAGEAAVQAMSHVGRFGKFVGALLLVAAVLAFTRWQRRRNERKAARRRLD
jgi:membrane protein DedA with SNARE-associated domain